MIPIAGRGRIKRGARISQDFRFFLWPSCLPPKAEHSPDEYRLLAHNPNMLFDMRWEGGWWDCRAPGYGYLASRGEVGEYGNGSIFVHDYDGIELVEVKMTEDQAQYKTSAAPAAPEEWPDMLKWESWPAGSKTIKRARVPSGYLVGQVVEFKKNTAFAMAFVPDEAVTMEKTTQIFQLLPDGSIATNRLVMTVYETARALGYGYGTMRNKMLANPDDPLGCGLGPVRLGKSIRFMVADVVQVVQDAREVRDSAQKSSAKPGASRAARRAKRKRAERRNGVTT